MFIVIEGADASGKAAQSRLLCERLANIKLYSFPRYETPLGRAILRHLQGRISVTEERTVDSSDMNRDGESYWRQASEDAMVFQCMMTIDKYAAEPEMRSFLGTGDVVADRWAPSACVYGVADGLDPAWLREIHACLLKADLYILLDVPLDEAVRRRPERRDRYERDQKKQERVRELYREMWKTEGATDEHSWVVLDGTGDVEVVNNLIINAIARKIGGRQSSWHKSADI
jgi:thymidylate kinase